jgi:hypothetical protein
MKEDAANLDRLHDLALPPEVSWWPLAPGWYVVIALVLISLLILGYRNWKKWRANAYRRAALREISSADSAPAIAELLRRTALATTPRKAVAAMTGTVWLDWLAEQTATAMPDTVRHQLASGIYQKSGEGDPVKELREYAACWIKS